MIQNNYSNIKVLTSINDDYLIIFNEIIIPLILLINSIIFTLIIIIAVGGFFYEPLTITSVRAEEPIIRYYRLIHLICVCLLCFFLISNEIK